MNSRTQPLLRRLWNLIAIRSAYGQLITLIFVPLVVLTATGSWVVITETFAVQRNWQRSNALLVLTQHQGVGAAITQQLLADPSRQGVAKGVLQGVLIEKNVQRVALLDKQALPLLTVGLNEGHQWPLFKPQQEFFGPLLTPYGKVFGKRVGFSKNGPVWLAIEVNAHSFEVSRYRIYLVVALAGLSTLLLMLLGLNIYSRRWIAPIYDLRIFINGLHVKNLRQPLRIKTFGEMRMLHKDILSLTRRLDVEIVEQLEFSSQQLEDMQVQVDELEMQNIKLRDSRKEAEKLNQLKSGFLANISHELRTPLNSMEGFLSLLQKRGGLNNEQQSFVNTLQRSSSHLMALINDVLDFSKIEAGQLNLERATFNLHSLVYDVVDMLSPQASAKGLYMSVYYYQDVPYFVEGDVLRLKQIATNLIGNAIKFTEQGDIIIRVSCEQTHLGKHYIEMSVQDSGIGLEGVNVASLFNAFAQADASVSREYGGTGLGLSIAHQLAGLMGGGISADDNKHLATQQGQQLLGLKGATFTANVCLHEVTDAITMQTPVVAGNIKPNTQVYAAIASDSVCNALQGYLAQLNVPCVACQSVVDLLRELNQADKHANLHVMVSIADGGYAAILEEIRQRFNGPVWLCDYKVAVTDGLVAEANVQLLPMPIDILDLQRCFAQDDVAEYNSQLLMVVPNNLHVMVVDDVYSNLVVMDALLSDMQVRVTTISSGIEAVELLQRGGHNFDLVFMDLQMPRLSGAEAVGQIRVLETELKTRRLPIVALTANALNDERTKLLQLGFDDYMSKPVSQDALAGMLNKWCTGATVSADVTEVALPTPANLQAQTVNWPEALALAAGKADLAFELLDLLHQSLAIEKQSLQQAYKADNIGELGRLAHRLHGACKYTGLPNLRSAVAALEYACSQVLQGASISLSAPVFMGVMQAIDELMLININDYANYRGNASANH